MHYYKFDKTLINEVDLENYYFQFSIAFFTIQ